MESIYTSVLDCIDGFNRLCAAAAADGKEEEDVPLQKIQDEHRRFKVWAGNIGAHRKGRSSLEYRLRDASHIRGQVIKLLEDLLESLSAATDIVRGLRIPWDKEPALDDEAVLGDHEDNSPPETEMSQIVTDIGEVVICLFRLSVTIRNPAPHDLYKQSSLADTSHFEHHDIEHVRALFPKTGDELAERLGRANSQRRQYFKYRKLRHEKLSHGIDFSVDVTEGGVESTVASSIPKELKDKAVTDGYDENMAGVGVVDEDACSTGGASHTSYGSSTGNNSARKIPPLPKESADGPFQCPFCYMMVSASTTIAWWQHVLGDLRPYICLSEACPAPCHNFQERRQWIRHVDYYHGDTSPDLTCPLCTELLPSGKEYARHVGRHQLELAMFALPSLLEEENPNSEVGEDDSIPKSLVDVGEGFEDVLASGDLGGDFTPEQTGQCEKTMLDGSESNRPPINNPRLLETVEDAIRRLILPELAALKELTTGHKVAPAPLGETGEHGFKVEGRAEAEERRVDVNIQPEIAVTPPRTYPAPLRRSLSDIYEDVDDDAEFVPGSRHNTASSSRMSTASQKGQQNGPRSLSDRPRKLHKIGVGTKSLAKMPITPAQGIFCSICDYNLEDEDSLQYHMRTMHARPYTCVFGFAGCESTFGSKNEWKRHVLSQHVRLCYWICTDTTCAEAYKETQGAIFNRKDLYTQHVRRMHVPHQFRKPPKTSKSGLLKTWKAAPEWEEQLLRMQEGAFRQRCELPTLLQCPALGCSMEFNGSSAWDDRMEHVARHLEKAALGEEPDVSFGGKADPTLNDWAASPRVGIIRPAAGEDRWELANPLPNFPRDSGRARIVKEQHSDSEDGHFEVNEKETT